MALILHIDTAVESGSVCLSDKGMLMQIDKNDNPRDHAAWIQPAIKNLMKNLNKKLTDLNAVSVSIGPGSYTGLRIGLASAKGICYALNIPLITIGTLEMMAQAAINESQDLLCPMIDARRMEVFTAVYDKKLLIKKEGVSLLIEQNSFSDFLQSNSVLFFGNGSLKFQNVCTNANASFKKIEVDSSNLIPIAEKKISEKNFTDLAYIEPLYLKDFYTPLR